MAIQSVKRDYTLHRRVVLLILLDLLAVNFSALAALLLRFEFSIHDLAESGFAQIYLKTAPLYSVLSILLFALLHLYRGLWAYASIDELRYILFASIGSALLEQLICYVTGCYLPRSMPILDLLFLFLSLTLIRYSYRILRRFFRRSQ